MQQPPPPPMRQLATPAPMALPSAPTPPARAKSPAACACAKSPAACACAKAPASSTKAPAACACAEAPATLTCSYGKSCTVSGTGASAASPRPFIYFPPSPSPLSRGQPNTRQPIPPELYRGSLAAFHAQGGFREAELPGPPPGWSRQHSLTPARTGSDAGANVDANLNGDIDVNNPGSDNPDSDGGGRHDSNGDDDVPDIGMDSDQDSGVDLQPTASRGRHPTSAQEREIEVCITQMLDLVQAFAAKPGLSSDRMLKAFMRRVSVEEALPRRRVNLWNMYQAYANHHENYEQEARRVYPDFNKDDHENEWRMESHELGTAYKVFKHAYGESAQEILETHVQLNTPDETFGQRRRCWEKLVARLENGVENIHKREDFEVMVVAVGPHVNEDSGLAEVICSPGLKAFPETIHLTEDDTIAAEKLTQPSDGSGQYQRRLSPASHPHAVPPAHPQTTHSPSAASASASASATATASASASASASRSPPAAGSSVVKKAAGSTSRSSAADSTSHSPISSVFKKGTKVKIDYSGMTAQEKREAQKSVRDDQLARAAVGNKALQGRLEALVKADVRRDIFHDVRHNGFAWRSVTTILSGLNLRFIGWPIEAPLPSECHVSKATNSWWVVNHETLNEAIDARSTPGHGLQLQPQEFTPRAYVIYGHDYSQSASSTEDFLYSDKQVPCADGEGETWAASYDLRHEEPSKATTTISIPNVAPVAKGKSNSKPKPKAKAGSKSAKRKGKAKARSDDEEESEEEFDDEEQEEEEAVDYPVEPRAHRLQPSPPCIISEEEDEDMPLASAIKPSTKRPTHTVNKEVEEDSSPPAKRHKLERSLRQWMECVEIASPCRQKDVENVGNIVACRTVSPSGPFRNTVAAAVTTAGPSRVRSGNRSVAAHLPANAANAAPARSAAPDAPARLAAPDRPAHPTGPALPAAPARPTAPVTPARPPRRNTNTNAVASTSALPAAPARPTAPVAPARPPCCNANTNAVASTSALPAAPARPTAPVAPARPPCRNANTNTVASTSALPAVAPNPDAAPLVEALVGGLSDAQLDALVAYLSSRQPME
ncbi:hypothetical protein C8R45DRAFT_1095609 [Mycena sanguinolenta]|nr:hypothetical protein C8R45DRAFT_1095609 [Mycena sanguinolenta]